MNGTVRAIWAARELGHRQALQLADVIVTLGSDQESIQAGQKVFESGQRLEWRLR